MDMRFKNLSVRAKLFVSIGGVVILSGIYALIIMQQLIAFSGYADATIEKQDFAGALIRFERFESSFEAITRAYADAGSAVTRDNYETRRKEYEALRADVGRLAPSLDDAERWEQLVTLREKLFQIEATVLAKRKESPAAARATVEGGDYAEYTQLVADMWKNAYAGVEKDIGRYIEKRNDVLYRMMKLALILFFLLAVAGVLIAHFVSKSIAAVARSMQEAAIAVGRGETGVRVPVPGKDELGKMAVAFNKMAVALEERGVSKNMKRITEAVGE